MRSTTPGSVATRKTPISGWEETLNGTAYRSLLLAGRYDEIAATRRPNRIADQPSVYPSKKMALRDAVKSSRGAKLFATGLYEFLHGSDKIENRFSQWCRTVAELPRRQTRVLTCAARHDLRFSLAQPATHIFLKPNVTRRAAAEYAFDFRYQSKPEWSTHLSKSARAGRPDSPGPLRSFPGGHDRCPVLPLGTGRPTNTPNNRHTIIRS